MDGLLYNWAVRNALTFDIEDYFQVGAFAGHVDQGQWGAFDSRVEANTDKILQILNQASQKATFFTLGWTAEKYPKLVRSIVQHGHEVACHSYAHRRIYEMTPSEFAADTRKAKAFLEDVAGTPVRGYRAPSFSLNQSCLWAFDILADLGFKYDSSIFPVEHPNYGMPEVPSHPFLVHTKSGSVVEFPMSTLAWRKLRSPFAGGAYLRLLPYSYTRWAIRFINDCELRPVCVYVHPWELDPAQPRINAGLTARVRHYLGLAGLEKKVRRLLEDFEFAPLGSMLPEEQQLPFKLDTTSGREVVEIASRVVS